MLALCELVTLPLTNLVMRENYLNVHTETGELIASTLSKLIMFIICKLAKKVAEKEIQKTKSIWLFIVPMLSVVLIFAIFYLSDENIDINKYNIVISISFMVLMVINTVVFKVHEDNVKSAKENEKLKLSEQKQTLDYENYKLLQENYENSRILIHDIKHHLNVINSMAENEDLKQYLKSLQLQEYLNNPQKLTGNKLQMNYHSSLASDYELMTSEVLLRRIIDTLIDNAIKNTPQGSITVSTSVADDILTISVEDTGTGVPEGEEEHIFERFVKLDDFKKGLGLGLPLCRALCRRLEGNVVLDRSYPGPGARFVVTLPL